MGLGVQLEEHLSEIRGSEEGSGLVISPHTGNALKSVSSQVSTHDHGHMMDHSLLIGSVGS